MVHGDNGMQQIEHMNKKGAPQDQNNMNYAGEEDNGENLVNMHTHNQDLTIKKIGLNVKGRFNQTYA